MPQSSSTRSEPITEPVNVLRGSPAQSLADLGCLAEAVPADPAISPAPSTATPLTRLSRELAEAAAMVRAVRGQLPEATERASRQLGDKAVRALLRAVSSALGIPPPADDDSDELVYIRLRSARAAESCRALARVLDDQTAGDLDLAWTAARLDDVVGQLPADSYEHSSMIN